MANFQDRFNNLYEDSDLSQEDFGRLFMATKNQVYNWRHGRGEPDLSTLKLIAKSCKVSVDWLVGSTNIPTPPEALISDSKDAYLYELPRDVAEKVAEFKDLLMLKYGNKDS